MTMFGELPANADLNEVLAPLVAPIIPPIVEPLVCDYCVNTDPRLSDARTPLPHNHDDVYVQLSDSRLIDAREALPHSHDYAPLDHSHPAEPPTPHDHDSAYVQLDDPRLSDARTPLTHVHSQNDVTGLAGALNAKQETSEKGQVNGYASLDSGGKVPAAQLPPSGSGLWTRVVLSADRINNGVANTLLDVTGLSFPVAAGQRYWFRFYIFYTAQVVTTGSRWTVNGPAFTALSYISEYSLTATTSTRNANVIAYNSPAASNASSGSTVGNVAQIEGFIQPSANGTVIVRFASEVANSAITAKAGSFVEYTQA